MVDYLLEMSHLLSSHVIGVEGNVSCKADDGFYIKGSGKSLTSLNKEDLVLCDKLGNSKSEDLKPSIEVGFHSWLFNTLDINFIAHTHPINTLKILCSSEIYNFAGKRLFPDQVVFNGGKSCVVEYYHPGDELLNGIKISVENYILEYGYPPKIILLKNHGIITYGKTIKDCILSTEMCEKSAEIFLGSLFKPNYLSDIDIDKIINDDNEKYRQSLIEK